MVWLLFNFKLLLNLMFIGLLGLFFLKCASRPTENSGELNQRNNEGSETGKSNYVPTPEVVSTNQYLVGAFRCPLWNKDELPDCWEPIKKYPQRKPLLGYYYEGNPEVTDWEIKYAAEHGISFFVECWFRKKDNLGKPAENVLGHWLESLQKSRFKDNIKFMILWENVNNIACGIASEDDLIQNLMPYWIETYFKQSNYLIIDNKPVFMIYGYQAFINQIGGIDKAKEGLSKMKQACINAGFDGLLVIGEHHLGFDKKIPQLQDVGFDAITSYHWPSFSGLMSVVPDKKEEIIEKHIECWQRVQDISSLPALTTVSMGWDSEPWGSTYYKGQWYLDPKLFKDLLGKAKIHIENNAGKHSLANILLIDNWNEYGEGHYIFPTVQFGFGYLDAIRNVFTDDNHLHQDILPEDLGLGPYE